MMQGRTKRTEGVSTGNKTPKQKLAAKIARESAPTSGGVRRPEDWPHGRTLALMERIGYSEEVNNEWFNQAVNKVTNDLNDMYEEPQSIVEQLRHYDILSEIKPIVPLKEYLLPLTEAVQVYLFLLAADNDYYLEYLGIAQLIDGIGTLIDKRHGAQPHSGQVFSVYLNFLLCEKLLKEKKVKTPKQKFNVFIILLNITFMYCKEYHYQTLFLAKRVTWVKILSDVQVVASQFLSMLKTVSEKVVPEPDDNMFLRQWVYDFEHFVLKHMTNIEGVKSRIEHILIIVTANLRALEA
jgi:hypothetical protein